jgi:LCP family protein required for cell wall assembly
MSGHRADGRARRRLRTLMLGVSATLALVIAAGTTVGGAVYLRAQGDLTVIAQPSHGSGVDPEALTGVCEERFCTYLILGSDSREGLEAGKEALWGGPFEVEGERSDTIMLVRIDTRSRKAVVLSFPRDLWVRIPGRGMNKINAAFEQGAYKVAETLTDLTGLEITHFVGVDLAGFRAVVDAMGGVPICVDRPMFDPKSGLSIPKAGCYTFNGYEALAFVRTRSQPTDCIPDFARIARQQQFLRAVLAKMLSPGQLWRIPRLVNAVADNLAVDEGFNILELADLASALNGVNTGDAQFRAVPTTPGWAYPDWYPDGLSVVRLKPEGRQLFKRLREGRPLGNLGETQDRTQISPANVAVRVFDAGSGGAAQATLEQLQRGGFDVAPGLGDPLELGTSEAMILFAPGAEDRAKVVARYVPGLTLQEAGEGVLADADVAVVIPSGFRLRPPGTGTVPEVEDPCG